MCTLGSFKEACLLNRRMTDHHQGATGEGTQPEVEEMMEDQEAAELQVEEAAQLHGEGEAAQLHDEGEEATQLHEGEEVEMSRNYIFLFFCALQVHSWKRVFVTGGMSSCHESSNDQQLAS